MRDDHPASKKAVLTSSRQSRFRACLDHKKEKLLALGAAAAAYDDDDELTSPFFY